MAEIWNMPAYELENQQVEVRTTPPEHFDEKPAREFHNRGVGVRIEQFHFSAKFNVTLDKTDVIR